MPKKKLPTFEVRKTFKRDRAEDGYDWYATTSLSHPYNNTLCWDGPQTWFVFPKKTLAINLIVSDDPRGGYRLERYSGSWYLNDPLEKLSISFYVGIDEWFSEIANAHPYTPLYVRLEY